MGRVAITEGTRGATSVTDRGTAARAAEWGAVLGADMGSVLGADMGSGPDRSPQLAATPHDQRESGAGQ